MTLVGMIMSTVIRFMMIVSMLILAVLCVMMGSMFMILVSMFIEYGVLTRKYFE